MSTPMDQPRPEPVVIKAEPGTRLEALAAEYDALEAQAKELNARFEDIKAAIKAELASAAPGAVKVDLNSAALSAPLRLQAKTSWRFDSKKFKAEDPETYVRYAYQSTAWELRRVTS